MREEGYSFDADSYFAYVHDISLDLIAPVPHLRAAIEDLPARKLVLTNADANHAWRVLWRLGLQECFERVIDIKVMGFVNKPHVAAYQKVQKMVNADASACVLIDDIAANTRGAGGGRLADDPNCRHRRRRRRQRRWRRPRHGAGCGDGDRAVALGLAILRQAGSGPEQRGGHRRSARHLARPVAAKRALRGVPPQPGGRHIRAAQSRVAC